MTSSTYTEERDCNECGDTYTASVYIGVGRDTSNGLCSECYSEQRQATIDRVLEEHPDKWYRPDSEEYVIAAYKPNGDRRYYRHDIHAVNKLERWYSE